MRTWSTGFDWLTRSLRHGNRTPEEEYRKPRIRPNNSRASSLSSSISFNCSARDDYQSISSSRTSITIYDRLPMRNKLPPVWISKGSSSRDGGRSKSEDARYYPHSVTDSRHPKELLSCQTKNNDARYYLNSSIWSSPQIKQSLPSHQESKKENNQYDTCNEAQTPSTEDDTSIESSSKSEDSDQNCSLSSPKYGQLTLAYAKHQIMVSMMQEVYAMVNSQWSAKVKTCVAPNAGRSRSQLESAKSENSSKESCNRKRRNHDREPSPDDRNSEDNNEKKRRGNPKDTRGCDTDRRFACPFYKYNRGKYCPNLDTGTKYRTCTGPGFSSVSKLK